eukprot:COSAG05_NODE_226_length_13453_cov_12.522315_13_plen_382_part_00
MAGCVLLAACWPQHNESCHLLLPAVPTPMPSGSPTQWFEDSFGFAEPRGKGSFEQTRAQFELSADHSELQSKPAVASGRRRPFHVGGFDTPSVAELRMRLDQAQALAVVLGAPEPEPEPEAASGGGGLTFALVSGCAKTLHLSPAHAGAVFQVASQFNCLEMVSPGNAPEGGVTCYAMDHTQGPACAMACPAGTVYRNYFWSGRGQAGGSAKQLDTSAGMGEVLDNASHKYWRMANGYLLPTERAAGQVPHSPYSSVARALSLWLCLALSGFSHRTAPNANTICHKFTCLSVSIVCVCVCVCVCAAVCHGGSRGAAGRRPCPGRGRPRCAARGHSLGDRDSGLPQCRRGGPAAAPGVPGVLLGAAGCDCTYILTCAQCMER